MHQVDRPGRIEEDEPFRRNIPPGMCFTDANQSHAWTLGKCLLNHVTTSRNQVRITEEADPLTSGPAALAVHRQPPESPLRSVSGRVLDTQEGTQKP